MADTTTAMNKPKSTPSSLMIACLLGLMMILASPSAMAKPTDALLFRGIGKALVAVLSIPVGVATGAAQGGFPFGIIGGVVKGTASAVGGTLSSAFDLARGGAPYAKYAAFL
ncbi:MAG: hypothetical protein KBC91_01080 [Candidatus Omnitrophica bacterium]|nr:hypothetical protein [Candidatus Omnitrophota bacterium]